MAVILYLALLHLMVVVVVVLKIIQPQAMALTGVLVEAVRPRLLLVLVG